MKNKILSYHVFYWGFWFRIFGRGLMIKNIKKCPLLFSQRNGFDSSLIIGSIYIGYLKSMP